MNKIKNDFKGFTLLELLVVVLIIGILAGIALPQYKRVVEKSKAMQIVSLIKALALSMENYYLVNSTYPTSFDQLDVEFPADWTGNKRIYGFSAVTDSKSNSEWSAVIEQYGNNVFGIHAGRLNGAYKGAEFTYYVFTSGSHSYLPSHRILCGEVIDGTYSFDKDEGDFCVKLFNGTKIHNSGIRLYTFDL